ncbi:MAG TPA: hypothetical protein VE842_03210 [Pyrinomonadaceae bacterium]|jgi:hypothetical protein|nr:hypothetical protein [Pyrinomonadaceae bacterium]
MNQDKATGGAGRTLVRSLDEQFARLHARSCALLLLLPAEQLYSQPRRTNGALLSAVSCGEHLLRSAAAVEQSFGGITANLWDDPFEWTLPEALKTTALVAEYLNEVEATRQRGFALLTTDGDLRKEIALPSGEMQTLCALLLETLVRAAHHQGRAFASFRLFSDSRLPQV